MATLAAAASWMHPLSFGQPPAASCKRCCTTVGPPKPSLIIATLDQNPKPETRNPKLYTRNPKPPQKKTLKEPWPEQNEQCSPRRSVRREMVSGSRFKVPSPRMATLPEEAVWPAEEDLGSEQWGKIRIQVPEAVRANPLFGSLLHSLASHSGFPCSGSAHSLACLDARFQNFNWQWCC